MNQFQSADILIPQNVSMEKWSVIACDQYTSQPEYWERVRSYVGSACSTLHLILPEAEMQDAPRLIDQIHQNMRAYLENGIFKEYKNSYVYVERTLADKTVRKGVVGAVDLEAYDYSNFSAAAIRATEQTVADRIPPRMGVRRDALLELPHALLLCDDDRHILLESLEAEKDRYPKLYDFDLMEGGGHIAGWLVAGEQAAQFDRRLDEYAAQTAKKYRKSGMYPMFFAVGDGNHSLATAKAYYEELKKTHRGEDLSRHPARYALAELENLHDDAQQFEPIHRIVTGTDVGALLDAMKKEICAKDGYPIVCCTGQGEETVYLNSRLGELPVAILQKFLDRYLETAAGSIDYIHGDDVLRALAGEPRAVGFLLPVIRKSQFFKGIVMDGVLPRKTFSMGHAQEKRYYLEARRIAAQTAAE